MFDPVPPSFPMSESGLDMVAMMDALCALDDAELAKVEDDLDFFHFTGFPSERLRGLIAAATLLRDVA